MGWRPRLNVVCGRCGKPRTGLRHDCVSNSRRKATVRPQLSFGKCPKCKKALGNPLTHICAPKSDFKARQRKAARREKERAREKARKKRQDGKHDYLACQDKDCPRPLCVAYKTGWKDGYRQGFKDGYKAGYDQGFPDGVAACPRPHQ